MGLPEHLNALLAPRAYPHPVQRVELIETHISWVLLAGDFAYKVKRPVCFSFVDLRSAARRKYLCEEEVRLNSRFAPELYLQTCAITLECGEARMEGPGNAIEHAVKMRRFARGETLDCLLERHAIQPEGLDAFGRALALMHAGLPTDARLIGHSATRGDIILSNLRECVSAAEIFGDSALVEGLTEPIKARLRAAESWIAARLRGGKVRECHGDLHSENVIRWADRLVAFDCLEFDSALRHIDVADEIAFLLSDLEARGYPEYAQAFLGGYLSQSGDYEACRHLPIYKVHRALVRAKVIALRAAQAPAAPESVRAALRQRYQARIDCARECLSHHSPVLVLMSGLSGSGKTWLARQLAPPLGAVHLRSDVERKRLADLPELASSGSSLGHGIYSDDSGERVYKALASAAGSALQGGYPTIVDATFGKREHRRDFQTLASKQGVPICIVRCQAPLETLQARLAERARVGKDASEAGLSVLDWQLKRHESIGEDESMTVLDVSSAESAPTQRLLHQINALRLSWRG